VKPIKVKQFTIYLILFIIAVTNVLFFACVDTYHYSTSSRNDQALFQRIALNILNHGEFSGSLNSELFFCPTRPPLYPLLLAGTWKITGTKALLPIRLIQGIAYLLSIFFIFRIAMMLTFGNKTYAFVSALYAALIPDLATTVHPILTEGLTLFFLSLSVFLAVSLRTKIQTSSLVLLGLTLGFLILQRPSFTPIILLFIGYILYYARRTARHLLSIIVLVTIPLIMVITPWIMVNKIKKGSFSPAYTALGHNLMQGIMEKSPSSLQYFMNNYFKTSARNLDRTPYYNKMEQYVASDHAMALSRNAFSPEQNELIYLATLTYIESWWLKPSPPDKVILSDMFLKKAALHWIRNNPSEFSKMVAQNIATLVWGGQPLVYQKVEGPIYVATLTIRLLLYILFFIGTIRLIRARRFALAFFPLTLILYLLIIHAPMHTEPRYFIYAYLFMTLAVPAGLTPSFLKYGQNNSPFSDKYSVVI